MTESDRKVIVGQKARDFLQEKKLHQEEQCDLVELLVQFVEKLIEETKIFPNE